MAVLIIGMLGVGKYMVGLDEADPQRFVLTQWHKTFGILILLLTVFRLVWRLTHRSPAHPAAAPRWERFASSISHFLLYALLLAAPVTGWMLVSVSPLNIDTLLFNVIPWPHLPWLHNLADKASMIHQYEDFHEWATGALIALLLLHIAAALKHHFVDKDTVLKRMLPSSAAGTGTTMANFVVLLSAGIGGLLFAYTSLNAGGDNLSSGASDVSAMATIMGESTAIQFSGSQVTASINVDSPESGSLLATVPTASVTSSNLQVQGALPDTEWFDSENYPEAVFESTQISAAGDGQLNVEGTLAIKEITLPHTFTLQVQDTDGNKTASGEFIVDRMAYQLGMESQPTDEYVGKAVTIKFNFELLSKP